MRTSHCWLLAGAVAAAVASLVVHASNAPRRTPGVAASADLLPDARQRALAATARSFADKAGPTLEDVGDVDSFGRNVTWLGVTQMNIDLAPTCPKPGTYADHACAVLQPAPAPTGFEFGDVARIALPPRATHSILCHWLSPVLQVRYENPTAGSAIARLNLQPTLTIENPVLDDPALLDPTTGMPFGGRLTTSMTASELFEVPLPPGMALTARERDSATCVAGFLTRRSLVELWGLTPAHAEAFFDKPTTVRMNLRGSAQYVSGASLVYGLRIVGD